MLAYCRSVVDSRFFWLSLAMHDIRKRYRRSILGAAWAILHPVFLALVISFVFSRAFQLGSRDYFLYVLTGLCYWNFLTYVLNEGCQSIRSGEIYIMEHRLPMAIYPLRWALVAAFHFLMAMIPVFVLSLSTGVPSLGGLLSVPLTYLLLLVFGWSLATICGIANVYFPDTQHFSQAGTPVLFYSTPIIWRPEMLRDRGLSWIVDYNPLAAFVDLIRKPLLEGTLSSPATMFVVVATVAACFLLAVLLLARCERKIVFRL